MDRVERGRTAAGRPVVPWRSVCLFAAVAWWAAGPASGATLLAHWHVDEWGAPFADAGANAIALQQDGATAAAVSGPGLEATAAYLNWVPATSATRLYAEDARLQTDSFGFSFWINPVNLNPFDSLLTKEMAHDNAIPAFARMGWQVHVLENNGSGAASLQLIVRGDQRGQGDFFGSVQSSVTLPLSTNVSAWYHVAGGYDASTGDLRLYVNGVGNVSANSSPGAHHADGSPVSLGSARNGPDVVTFSAITFMDDVQLYDAPLTAGEVAFLRAHPGREVRDLWVAGQAVASGGGDIVLGFDALGDRAYTIGVSDDFAEFATAAVVTSSIPLLHDAATASALPAAGATGDGAQLRWVSPETSASRLYASDAALQTDSFGFSFWMKPDNINPFDNLLTKEMAAAGSGDLFTRMSWQVQVLDNNGSGLAPLQLIVRGDDRSQGDFYGTAVSAAVVPLYGSTPYWIHVAGGYDAQTGALRLYVNAAESVSGNSSPGARNSGGGALSVGSARNGPDFVSFAAAAHVDDVQIYDGPPGAADAAFLKKHPGGTLPHVPRLLAHWPLDEAGAPYADVADGWRTAAVSLSPAALDAALGGPSGGARIFKVTETDPAAGY
jgi:hypothetical protein